MAKRAAWVDQGLKMYREGLSYQKIAARLGLATPTVWRALRDHGCRSRSRAVFTEETTKIALELYALGMSYGEIADYFGVSRMGAYYRLKSRGCASRPQLRFGADNHFYRGGETQDDRAQNIVEKAILYGRLTRGPCERCGANGTFRDGRHEVQAHHCDYNKPLNVMWLCQKCHHLWHKQFKAVPVDGAAAAKV